MAAASDPANPPVLDDSVNYECWKKDLAVWELYTGTEKSKRGPRLYLCLRGKARDIVRDLPLEEISGDNGLERIKRKLDDHYEKDKVQRAFINLENFEKYKRSPDISISEFVSKFEQLNNKVKEDGMKYPDGVLGYKLLAQCNLSEGERNLIKATMTDLTYDNMKKALLSVFSDITKKPNIKTESTIKVEETFYNEKSNTSESFYSNKGNYRGRNNRGRYNRGRVNTRGRSFNSMTNRGRGGGRKLNPSDESGEPSKCAICNSIYHWARECPDAYENQYKQKYNNYYVESQSGSVENENINPESTRFTMFCNNLDTQNITLFNMDQNEETCERNILLGESFSTGILDTGAPDNVCGRRWLDEYISTLNPKELTEINRSTSNKYYKFGNTQVVKAIENIELPMTIANTQIIMNTDVVDLNVPLLISKKALKKANAELNFIDNTLKIFGKSIKLLESKSGHYLLPIQNHLDAENVNASNLYFIHESDDVKKNALKIHRHFSHARKERIRKLLEDAGIWNTEYSKALSEIEETCKSCKIYKKPPSRPVVGLSFAKCFNEIVGIDLKDFKHEGKVYKLLHVVDHATRFSQATRVKSKTKEEILKALFECWICVFGPPQRILSDNGGEFLNKDFIELCDKFDIKIKMTAAESPWGNGMVERHHKVLCNTLEMTLEEIKNFDIALNWAIQAKNSLYNLHGFSPFILVFGKNPRLPNILNGSLPSMETTTTSEYLANNLNAMNKARISYIKAENQEKVKRALRHNVSSSVDTKYVTGDRVYIKRRDDNRWSGPGTVLGQEYQQVLVRIGGFYYRVHPCRIVLVGESERIMNEKLKTDNVCENQYEKENFENQIECTQSQIENLENQIEPTQENENNQDEIEQDEQNDVTAGENHEIEDMGGEIINNGTNEINKNIDGHILKPKRNQHIEYVINGETKRGIVMNRQPKQTGSYRKWINISEIDGEDLCVNFDSVTQWRDISNDIEGTDEIMYCTKKDKEEILAAKESELENWRKNYVYEEVNDVGQPRIGVKWVLSEKLKDGKWKIKARLVAKGYEDVEKTRNDSPTCSKESVRIMLTIGAAKGWSCKSLDIKAAFLQGKPLEREVFLKPPSEFKKEGIIWRLNKCVYGLNQASRNWFLTVKRELIHLGAEIPKVDPAYFVWKKDGNTVGVLSSHVDDFLIIGELVFQQNLIKELKTIFEISSETENMFVYLGINLRSNPHFYEIDQLTYINKLKAIEISETRKMSMNDQVTEIERAAIRSAIGKLLWAANTTRPDISFLTSVAASAVNTATVNHISEVNKIISICKGKDVVIKFPQLNSLENASIVVYADASLGNLREGASQGAYIIFLKDKQNNCSVLSWSSQKIKRVVRSVLTAETLAMSDAVDKAMVLNELLSNVIFCDGRKLKIICFTDSKSLADAVQTSNTPTEKRLLIDISSLRQARDREEIEITWIPTKCNLANALTKKSAFSASLISALKTGKLNF